MPRELVIVGLKRPPDWQWRCDGPGRNRSQPGWCVSGIADHLGRGGPVPTQCGSYPARLVVRRFILRHLPPFEDGNRRIGRANAEKALSQGTGRPVLLSLSSAIEADRSVYYGALTPLGTG